MGELTLGIVASARTWRTELQAHVRDHVTGMKVQILREPRMALEAELDVIVIDDVSSFLSKNKVQLLQSRGVRVVGIFDPEEQAGQGQGYLETLGVDLALPSTTRPEDMLFAVEQLQPSRARATGDVQFDSLMADFDLGAPSAPHVELPASHGRVIAVAGPGGTGASEVAIGLADAFALRGEVALLIDADETAPTIARRLCYQLQPNVLTAIDAVLHQTHPLPQVVGRRIDHSAGHVGFHVIPGIANPDDWSQLRASEVTDLLTETRRSWGITVVNAGRSTEDLSAYGFERFGATRSALMHADLVVAVCMASPVGVLRMLEWLAAYRALGRELPVFVVFNRAPGKKFARAQLEAQLFENAGEYFIAGHCFVDDDERVYAAEWEGRLVANGPFTKAMSGLAELVAPSTRPTLRRAKPAAREKARTEPAPAKKAAKNDRKKAKTRGRARHEDAPKGGAETPDTTSAPTQPRQKAGKFEGVTWA